MNFDPTNVILKYMLIINSHATSLSKKPLQLHKDSFVDDGSDYEVLQLEMRRLHRISQNQHCGSGDKLDNHTFQLRATLVKSN